MNKRIILIAAICMFAYLLPMNRDTFANNLTLGGTITVVSGDQISFTIKWDNSWYASTVPNNWDAVWLFVKYKDCSTTNWQHAPLSTTSTDHSISGGDGLLSIEMPAAGDGKGVFIRRTATGSGNITNAETVTLKLGVSTGSYNFKVFGIEMVKILNEDFQVGDGAASDRFNSITITSEGALTAAVLGGTGTVATVIGAYPKGWAAFYCMKYEVSQEQYMDFLNCLTYDQQATRTNIPPNQVTGNKATAGYRKVIAINTSGVASSTPAVYGCDLSGNVVFGEVADGQNVACNGISWADLAAYLDWACLRPMTDLEFEKICRGALGRLAGEYAWGNVAIVGATGPTNSGQASETFSNAGAPSGMSVYWIGGGGNILRGGFAAKATTTRDQAGATYYGVMEMSGNVWERVVGTHTGGGDTYTGVLGDGALDASGNANQANWSGTNAVGTGCRGGGFDGTGPTSHVISNRQYARNDDATRTFGNNSLGGRGVR